MLVSPEGERVNFDGFRCEQVRPGLNEVDTFTCWHCSRIVHVRPRAPLDEFGSMCRNCMKMVCPACADKGCTPYLKKIEESEKRDMMRRLNAQWI